MSTDLPNYPDLPEVPDKPWAPSAALYGQLLLGTVAVLIAGALSVAGSAVELAQPPAPAQPQGPPQPPAFTVAMGLDLAGTVVLLLVFGTYMRLARETESLGLRKSSFGLLVGVLAIAVLGLMYSEVLPPGWDIAAAVVLGVGLVAMLVIMFYTPTWARPHTKQEEATATADAKKAGAGLGGLGVAAFFVIKFGVRFLLKGKANPGFDVIVGIGATILLVFVLVYAIWFGVAKIRLRPKLGMLASLLGWVEILVVLAGVALLGVFVFELFAVLNQPNMEDDKIDKAIQDLMDLWGPSIGVGQIVVTIVWTVLTAFLFVTLRSRHEPDWSLEQQTL